MVGIVLGSGLGDFVDHFEVVKRVSFGEVLDVNFEELDGHTREFVWCEWEGHLFLVVAGKLHFYEGHEFNGIIAPLKYAVDELGVERFIVTSASGGLSDRVKVGELAYVKQIVSIPEVNMKIQESKFRKSETGGEDEQCKIFQSLSKATYAYHQGPSLGTAVEYQMLNYLDADLVGMSMLPEFCYLRSVNVESHSS